MLPNTPLIPPPPPWYRRRWVKLTAIIVAAVVIVVAIVAAVLLFVWNSSPQKALLDATTYALETPGTYHVTAASTDITFTSDNQKYAASGTVYGVPLDVVVLGDTLYLKSSDPERLYDVFVNSSSTASVAPLAQNVLAAIKDRWISFNLFSSPVKSTGISATSCFVNGRDVLVHDGAARQQIAMTYLPHQFMTIATQNQSTYRVAFDGPKLSAFMTDIAKTNVYQSLPSCTQAIDPTHLPVPNGATATVTLNSKHILSSLILNDHGAQIAKVTAKYGAVPAITTPSNALSMDQLTNTVFQSLAKSFFGSD